MDIKQSAATSTEEFKRRIFFALSEPGRYTIVRMLYRVGHEMGCGELNQHIEIDKSTMSYHLRTLREIGREKFVQLNTDRIDAVLPGLLASL